MTRESDPHDVIYNLIGEATVAWNGIEHGWMLVFQALLGAPESRAKAAYLAVTNSSTQRDMIAALAKIIFLDGSTMSNKIGTLLEKTGKKSGWRNSFSHGFYGVDVYKVAEHDGLQISPLKVIDGMPRNRLIDKDLEAELRKLIPEFNTLATDVFGLYQEIPSLDATPPSPGTPPQPP